MSRVAVVTGAASGIGLSVAERFAEEGAAVALLDSNPEQGREAAARVGDSSAFVKVDLAEEGEIIAAADRILNTFGRVDHLVNNAGIVLVKSIEECTAAEWDLVMNVNVRSVFLMTKYLLPALRKSPHPTIVNVGSVSSFVAQKDTPAYVASKGAVAMLSKSLALDLSPFGIRVNCVCPGITDTPMFRFHVSKSPAPEKTFQQRIDRVPLRRALSPNEIADAILYLSGEHSSGITGTTLLVDAGYLAAAEWSNRSD
jgi:NAD(P)-dependent dehydrogenase (short-subunit alcohol dehydrogenase family)